MIERCNARDHTAVASHGALRGLSEGAEAHGVYHAVLRRLPAQHQREAQLLLAREEHFRRMLRTREGYGLGIDLSVAYDNLLDMREYVDGLREVVWEDTFPNVVATVGKNQLLDAGLAGSAYTVTGPYMGLISSTSYSAVAAGDTMSSHAGWLEAGNANTPTYSGGRKTISWNAASGGAKGPSSAPVFTFTGAGTVKGGFVLYGSGAVATVDNTSGVLYSAGLFTGGDKIVASSDTLTITYSTSL